MPPTIDPCPGTEINGPGCLDSPVAGQRTLSHAIGRTLIDRSTGPGAPGIRWKVDGRFLRPVRPGRLAGKGRVVHRDGDLAFLEAALSDADGVVVATAAA
jgi:acyl-coenzyme A thioesterase PaaI-like protein